MLFGPGGVSFRLKRPAQGDAARGDQPCAPLGARGLCRGALDAGAAPDALRAMAGGERAGDPAHGTVDAVTLRFAGAADEGAAPIAAAPSGARISVLRGPRETWRRGLPAYGRLVYRDVWPGIDVVYDGSVNRLKHTFIVHPGADPSAIRLRWDGARGLRVDAGGQLVVDTAAGPLTDEAPVAWQVQEVGAARASVAVRYALGGDAPEADGATYGFAVDAYDRSRTLVIDPAMFVYVGFLGVAGNDRGLGIAVDADRNVYLTGDLDQDAYVAKVSADGRQLVYLTVFAGDAYESGFDVAVDAAGAAYVTGATSTYDATFPVHRGPSVAYGGGSADAFVAKLSPDGGDAVYAGYLGGAGTDFAEGIAVDAAGNAYLTGIAASTEATFPVKIGPDVTQNGRFDAFVTKLKAEPFAANVRDNVVWSGFIGGAGDDVAVMDWGISSGHIAIDAAGNAYISGQTNSDETTFPDGDGVGALPGPDRTYNGDWDAFVVKVHADGAGFGYAGYIGGAGYDEGKGMAVDAAGAAYLTGQTNSTEATFPVKVGPDLTFNGMTDAYIAKVAPDGASLEYCGYIGGDDDEQGAGVALGPDGAIYVAGSVQSGENTFPVTGGPDLTFNGPDGETDDAAFDADAFVGRLRSPVATGDPRDSWDFLGYAGGADRDSCLWLTVDGSGDAYIVGETISGLDTFPDGRPVGDRLGFGGLVGKSDVYMVKVGWRPRTARTAYLPWLGRNTAPGEVAAPAPFAPTATNTVRPNPTATPTARPWPTPRPTKPVALPPGEELLFADDFSDPNVPWLVGGDSGAGGRIVDGALVLSAPSSDANAVAIAPATFGDGAIEVTVQRLAEDDQSFVGVTFGPEYGGFLFWAFDDGNYGLFERIGQGLRALILLHFSDALLPKTAVLRLRIERAGSTAKLLANGRLLTEVTHPHLAERGPVMLRLLAGPDGPSSARFDDVLITRFTAERPTPTAAPKALAR
ncbi:MAG: SBBP repeat-containing protein [Anaerolineae bacterium]